eukprot:COSAG02_NODE_1936_length_10314_cov_6.250024_7_plen_44_part_00
MIENQPNYYDACKVKLYTKYEEGFLRCFLANGSANVLGDSAYG